MYVYICTYSGYRNISCSLHRLLLQGSFPKPSPSVLDKIKVYKRDGLKIIITIRNLQGTPTVTASFSLFAITTNTLFLQTISLSRVVGNNNLIQFLNSLVTQENCQYGDKGRTIPIKEVINSLSHSITKFYQASTHSSAFCFF